MYFSHPCFSSRRREAPRRRAFRPVQSHWPGVERQESLQIQGSGDIHQADSTTCCPIRTEGFEQLHDVAPQPCARPHNARETRKAVLPLRDVAHKFFRDSCSLRETAAGGNTLHSDPQSPSGDDSSCGHVNGDGSEISL